MREDYYAALGLPVGAPVEAVLAANEDKLKRIAAFCQARKITLKEGYSAFNEAYAVLSDPRQKANYDRKQALFGAESPPQEEIEPAHPITADVRKDYYKTLGLPNGASVEEVLAARAPQLKRLTALHKTGGGSLHEDFAAFEEAFAVLSDPDKKAGYDRMRTLMAPELEKIRGSLEKIDIDDGAPSSLDPEKYPFKFTGSGSEYFRIWIVNLLLSIVTLGIYSAWAKVRREQYFHRNTLLDGSGFDYHGNPVAIFKGRVIVLVLALGLIAIEHLAPDFYLIALLAVSPVYPWLFVRSFRFRARNTSYRGVRFNFHGTYGGIIRAFWPGLLLFLILIGVQSIPLLARTDMLETGSFEHLGYAVILFTLLVLGFMPSFFRNFKRFQLNHLSFGGERFNLTCTLWACWKVWLILVAIVFIPVVCFGVSFGSLLMQAVRNRDSATLIALLIAGYALLIFIWNIDLAYFQSRAANVVWNNTNLAAHRFASDQRCRDVFLINLTNWLLIAMTAGLFWPWARIRLAKYRANHTSLLVSGGLDDFMGEAVKDEHAIGEEIADAFDFDIAI